MEELRLVGLALVPALVRVEELHVGETVLLEVCVLDGAEHVLPPVEVDHRDGEPVEVPEEPVRLAQLPEFAGQTIVVILPDASERYLSTALFEGIG